MTVGFERVTCVRVSVRSSVCYKNTKVPCASWGACTLSPTFIFGRTGPFYNWMILRVWWASNKPSVTIELAPRCDTQMCYSPLHGAKPIVDWSWGGLGGWRGRKSKKIFLLYRSVSYESYGLARHFLGVSNAPLDLLTIHGALHIHDLPCVRWSVKGLSKNFEKFVFCFFWKWSKNKLKII